MTSCSKTIAPNNHQRMDNPSTKESDVSALMEQLPAMSPTDERVVLQRIADPSEEEGDVLALMGQLRAALPTDDQAELWARIANSDEYSDARRRRAVLLLFDRHVRRGMELRTVTSLLDNPVWLKRDNIHLVDLIAGWMPIDMVNGETVFCVIAEFSPLNREGAVYLRVQWDPFAEPSNRDHSTVKDEAEKSFYNALLGKESEAATLKITAVAASPSLLNDEDQRLFDHTNERKMFLRISDPSEKESDVLALMEQLRTAPLISEMEEKILLAQIANSDEYSDTRRRLAVCMQFERHVYSGMRLEAVSCLTTTPAFPTWLKKDNIHIVRDPGDKIPIDVVPDETVFVITPKFSSLDRAMRIYLRVQGLPSVESFYKIFGHDNTCWGYTKDGYFFQCRCEQDSEVATLKITAVAVSLNNDDDQRLFGRKK